MIRNTALIGTGTLIAALLIGSSVMGAALVALAIIVLWTAWQIYSSFVEPDPLADIGPISTARLRLRPTVPGDVEALAAVMDEEVVRVNGWPREARRRQLQRVRRSDRAPVPGQWVMADASTDIALGILAVNEPDPEHSCIDIGWYVGPDARGKGYGTEAAAAAIEGLHRAGYRRVTSSTAEDNFAVRHILEKIGARMIERRRQRLPDGTDVHAAVYAHDVAPTSGS